MYLYIITSYMYNIYIYTVTILYCHILSIFVACCGFVHGWRVHILPPPRMPRCPSGRTRWLSILAKVSWSNIWGFPKMEVPQNGWFIEKIPIKMDDLGFPLFQEPPHLVIPSNRHVIPIAWSLKTTWGQELHVLSNELEAFCQLLTCFNF